MEEYSCEKIGDQDHTTVVQWEDFCFSIEAESGTSADDQF